MEMSTTNTSASVNYSTAHESDFEIDNISLKTVLGIVSLTMIMMLLTVVLALRKTRRVPYASKLLAQLLLSIDCLVLMTTSIRRFMTNPILNIQFHVFSILSLKLNVLTVAIISIERLFLFYRPLYYLHYLTHKRVKIAMSMAWCTLIAMYYSVRIGMCGSVKGFINALSVPRTCTKMMLVFQGCMIAILYSTVLVCYMKMYMFIKRKIEPIGEPNGNSFYSSIRRFKSASFIGLNLFAMILNTILYTTIVLITNATSTSEPMVRLYLDMTTFLNCLLDPLLYVFWFKECRMMLLNVFSCCNHRFEQTAERMRLEVYDIVTTRDLTAASDVRNS